MTMNAFKWVNWLCVALYAPLVWGQQGSVRTSKLHFQNQSMSFGVISADDKPVERSFVFQNLSADTISITRVLTACGCTSAQFSTAKVAPKQKGVVKLRFNPHLRSGKQQQQAFVYTNVSGFSTEAAILQLVGEVTPTTDPYAGYPTKVGVLRTKRNVMTFRFERGQAKCAETLLCINSSAKALTLSAPSYSFLKFSTVPVSIPAHAEAEIELVIDAAKWKQQMGNARSLSLPIKGMVGTEAQLQIEVQFSE